MLGLLLAAALAQHPADAPPESAPALVYLADGTSLPLQGWILSYEYLAWDRGSSPALGTAARRESSELWLGKRRLPTAGTTLDFVRKAGVPPRLVLAGADRPPSEHKPEAPSRELLRVPRGQVHLARSLDLRGQSLTGTRRDFCLLSYSVTVDCGDDPARVVTRIEFPPASDP